MKQLLSRHPSVVWVLVPISWALLSVAGLWALTVASFGPNPSIGEAHHVFLGELWLLSSGSLGFAICTGCIFRLLRSVRAWVAALSIALACFPCLIFALCQLVAWAMFVGLA
jgi:hypothetical protein